MFLFERVYIFIHQNKNQYFFFEQENIKGDLL